ncbi:hypothetical protein [Streptomyces sp. NBC_01477]|uniref:hypothetical protein n=1 Tax=Streptomyces sp. NBC_01477 TaxID=2976015 RepID=UPI002E30EE0A|nr:hypothetical protein [Streptomyces sp. NBC_01477]
MNVHDLCQLSLDRRPDTTYPADRALLLIRPDLSSSRPSGQRLTAAFEGAPRGPTGLVGCCRSTVMLLMAALSGASSVMCG